MTKKVTKFLREKVQHKHQYQGKPSGCHYPAILVILQFRIMIAHSDSQNKTKKDTFIKTRSHSNLIEGGIKY